MKLTKATELEFTTTSAIKKKFDHPSYDLLFGETGEKY